MSQYKKGESGNRAGRPRGSRNKANLLIEGMLPDLLETVKQAAMEGNIQACGILLRYGMAPQKSVYPLVNFSLPKEADPLGYCNAILSSIATGILPADIGGTLIQAVSDTLKIQEVTKLEDRIIVLEELQNKHTI